MSVACGQCLGCRLDKSQMWAARIVHEAHEWDHNCFITLTYSDEHLPADGSLDKKHFQKFMKRLRKHFRPKKIRYYHCGEYGGENDRPHYHACLFNLDFADKELWTVHNDNPLYTSPTLEKLWPFGFVTIGALTYQSAAYAARYCLKKITGNLADEHYKRFLIDEDGCIEREYWLQPEYTTMSRRPGIGRNFYDRYKSDFFPSDETPIPGEGVRKTTPRYYEQILRDEDPDAYETIKNLRQAFREAHGDEYSPERLMAKYKVKKAQVGQLTRRFSE